ncbi:replication-relaxation family protein [Amycolatopsis sp. CA-126428]|uniref:replication-relaxation family protein n=1 Tax=Amycolatopsis sp. CA-126428 TaxID=2073158 RepID=UPI000CD3246C|nr:replication-relaxation family protein [Amycolatopsis sp. CA-126428]
MTAARTPTRVRSGHMVWVAERLGERDRAILETVNRLHLATGLQLERLHFTELSGRSRVVSRSRTLARLVSWRVLLPLPRRVGGPRRGSTVTVFALDTAGARLLKAHAGRVRRPGAPGERVMAHIVAVSELYVSLVEFACGGRYNLRTFQPEPACWWPDGRGGVLKPDAFAVLSNGRVDHLWWVEVDRSTESLPTLRRKLRTYLDFVNQGGRGPRGGVPRVLVTVLDDARLTAVQGLIRGLPPPAAELFFVSMHDHAALELSKWFVR